MTLFHIYTDGACSGNPGPGGWGVVLLDADKRPVLELSGYHAATTNNRMEIQAALEGIAKVLELVPNPEIILYSDSSYLINAYTKGWMNSWLRSNWKKGEVKNQDLWQELNTLLQRVKIQWVKVKGHSDNIHNNRCDQLAVKAIKTKITQTKPFERKPLEILVQSNQKSEGDFKSLKPPSLDPATLNNPLSKKPSENRCLVSLTQVKDNIAKIRQVADRSSYQEMKKLLDPGTMGSVNSSIAYATFNHPSQKVHPFFLQAGDMADFWLARNSARAVPYPAPTRTDLIKYICAFIADPGLEKAGKLGLGI